MLLTVGMQNSDVGDVSKSELRQKFCDRWSLTDEDVKIFVHSGRSEIYTWPAAVRRSVAVSRMCYFPFTSVAEYQVGNLFKAALLSIVLQ
jgi:hypothetical protein